MSNYTELPEKWSVKRNQDNYEIINKWINDGVGGVRPYHDTTGYISYPNTNNGDGFSLGNHSHYRLKEGYTEITFEQFQEHVLKVVNESSELYKIY